MELKSLTKGTKLNQRFRSSENIERAQLEEKEFNFLYSDDSGCFFMDPENFEQISLKKELLGEKLKLLNENLKVTISFLEEKPLSVDLPTNIECEIESTEGVVKKQTASSSYKPAKLKNGLDNLETYKKFAKNVANVKHESLKRINQLLKEDKNIIEDLILAAHNSAKSQLKSKTAEEISKTTGGFGIPGFKWPL